MQRGSSRPWKEEEWKDEGWNERWKEEGWKEEDGMGSRPDEEEVWRDWQTWRQQEAWERGKDKEGGTREGWEVREERRSQDCEAKEEASSSSRGAAMQALEVVKILANKL